MAFPDPLTPARFTQRLMIERLINGFSVPIFTRQIRKGQTNMPEAHEKFARESLDQIREKGKQVLTAR